ncbi:Tat (twin-arginine translocation) pathway signal sequence [Micrococcus luteus]|uniref:Tat (twin-arginine translocation) pathway signal sequence n=1 Tax=Micrococcus luteus TaxID=1270 RepID=UPI0021B2BA3E|nr:Tat (twin-arginine translocation) pathway signal sequence [Micrococcus luteus]MCV7665874.1 Tat (twin-arginine translocation) pathway signal sequence [Micrococcus luteus]
MQRRRAVRAAGLGVVGALALAGCASEPQSVGEAWHQARTQLDEAETVRLETAYTTGRQGPQSVRWDIAGRLDGGDAESKGVMQVGRDSHITMESRQVGEDVFVRVDVDGSDVPDDVQMMYSDPQWRRVSAGEGQEPPLKSLLDQVGLPAADALDGAQVRAEEVDWDGGTAYRYAVPEEVADAAMAEGDATRVHSFTVDDDGELVALTVDDGRATQQYALSDWNQIEPAEAPEEVAE